MPLSLFQPSCCLWPTKNGSKHFISIAHQRIVVSHLFSIIPNHSLCPKHMYMASPSNKTSNHHHYYYCKTLRSLKRQITHSLTNIWTMQTRSSLTPPSLRRHTSHLRRAMCEWMEIHYLILWFSSSMPATTPHYRDWRKPKPIVDLHAEQEKADAQAKRKSYKSHM